MGHKPAFNPEAFIGNFFAYIIIAFLLGYLMIHEGPPALLVDIFENLFLALLPPLIGATSKASFDALRLTLLADYVHRRCIFLCVKPAVQQSERRCAATLGPHWPDLAILFITELEEIILAVGDFIAVGTMSFKLLTLHCDANRLVFLHRD